MKNLLIAILCTAAFIMSYPTECHAAKKEKKTEQKVAKATKTDKAAKATKQSNKKGLFGKKKSKKNQQAQTAPAKDSVKVEKPQVDRPGLFHVIKDKDNWFFEIADSLIGREILVTVRFTTTPASCGKFGGEQVNQQTVFFELSPEGKLLLRSKLFINVADSTQEINRAITISNEHPIIGAFKVESHANGTYKINVGGFFRDDNPALGIPEPYKADFGLRNILPDMGYIEDIKSFPLNTEVRTIKTYVAAPGKLPAASRAGKVTLGLNISFVLLPDVPMQRRIFDPRVGFFTEGWNSYTDDQQRVERKVFAARWRLECRPEDKEKMQRGELVEPIKPIIYYVDPATPKQWRKYLIQGVNDWQEAFEAAGWKNAIQGREWPENDSTMSMEDARYSCIRYLASPIANAYGPNVHDPRTGEIMESHICWYHNVMTLVHDWYMVQASSIDEAARKMRFDEDLMGQLIRFVSSHEVGHTLGLRHNFGSSSTVPVDSLRSKSFVEKYGHTPSIMDYARFNYVAQPEDGISRQGIFPRINDYDKWVIKWGYSPSWAENEHEDQKIMAELTTKTLKDNPRLWWLDGESSAGSIDPRRQTEDLGDDAMKASTYGVMNLKREVASLFDWTKDDERDYYGDNLRSLYGQMTGQFRRYIGHVSRNIGGYLLTTRLRGDDGIASEPQPKAKQKDALKWMNDNVLKEPTWLRDVPYATQVAVNPQDLTLSFAAYGVNTLINRVNSLNDLYKADEFLADLCRMTFTELESQAKVTPYRAAVHRAMVDGLIAFKNSASNARPAALYHLQQLERKTKAAATSAPDKATRAHWAAIYDTIGRALKW